MADEGDNPERENGNIADHIAFFIMDF